MFELIKKSLLASLGAAVITKEKIEQVTKRLVDEGKISMDEAGKLTHELVESGHHQWEELQEKITSTVRKAVENLDLVRKGDLQDLDQKVEEMEKRLAALEQANLADKG